MVATRSSLSVWVGIMMILLVLSGCGRQETGDVTEPAPPNNKTVMINGAGASFPYPLYSRWIDRYSKIEKNVRINYQSIGSGAGIEQISKKVIDFGGSDAPVSDKKLKEMPDKILHIPTVLGAVAITYNLPGIEQKVKFSPDVLVDIYLGKIRKWNDQRLLNINPKINLPDQNIMVVHRSDGSGTTNIFTDYLSNVSPEWNNKVGRNTSVQWHTGVGAKGNEGLSRQVQATVGSIGYVELSYALMNKLPYGLIKNKAGRFVEPTLESTIAAATGFADNMPDDMRVSIVNAPGENSYPIVGYTYILVYLEQDDFIKGRALASFLWWAVHEGEEMAAELVYAPLPAKVVKKVEEKLRSMTCAGKPLI